MRRFAPHSRYNGRTRRSTEPLAYIPSSSSYIPTKAVVNDVDLYQEAWQQFAKRFAEALYSLRRFEEIAQKQNSEHSKLINKAANAMIQLQRQLTTAISE